MEMVEAEGGKVAGKKRTREDKGKGKAVEEAETEEEQQRKKQRGDRLREIHDGMKIGDRYKDPCNRCIKDGVECRRAKGVRSTSCNACIEGKKKCVWSWEDGAAGKSKAKPKPKPKVKQPEIRLDSAAGSEAGGEPEAGPSKKKEKDRSFARHEEMGRKKDVCGLIVCIFKDIRKTRVAQESIAYSLERLADKFAPLEAEETEEEGDEG